MANDKILQNAVAADGNGDILTTLGLGVVAFQVSGTFVATVNFEGTVDGSNWVALKDAAGVAITATAAGIWRIPVGGLAQVRARISGYASGTITVVALGQGSNGGDTQPVSGPLTDTELRATAVPVSDSWRAALQADVTDNDSDKTVIVPASTEWQVLALHITLTTSADVGDRQLSVLITNAADVVLAQVRPGVVQAASLTRYYSLAVGQPDDFAFYDTDLLRVPLPLLPPLPAGYKVRVYDKNAVAAAADNLHIVLTVAAR